MIKSMTGYGKGESADPQGRCVVEIKTVNNRYGEVSVKMPRSFLAYEHEVRKAVGMRAPILVEARPNARWSLDFVHDQFANGQRFIRHWA